MRHPHRFTPGPGLALAAEPETRRARRTMRGFDPAPPRRRAWTGAEYPLPRPEDAALRPLLGALRAIERDLREARLDSAWIDLDLAALRLAREDGEGCRPAIRQARVAVERARDQLGQSDVAQALSGITGALRLLGG